jgi:hypothetical protein
MIQKVFILSLFVLMGHPDNSEMERFEKGYKFDIENAVDYYSEIKGKLSYYSKKFKTNDTVLSCIVFPELVRYSKYKDFFETKALEILYIQYGKQYADFSIGKFQMKPSFIEQLETYIKNRPDKFKGYKKIYSYESSADDDDKRAERLKRLKNQDWQILYLNCLYCILEFRFENVRFANLENKIKFYATCYNHGFLKSKDEIFKWQEIQCFPFGYRKDGMNQYRYSDISLYFFYKMFNKV